MVSLPGHRRKRKGYDRREPSDHVWRLYACHFWRPWFALGDFAMIIALITLRIIDQILTWNFGRRTEQNPIAKKFMAWGLWPYAWYCLFTTGALILACELIPGDTFRAYGYGIASGAALMMLATNVNYLIRRKRG